MKFETILEVGLSPDIGTLRSRLEAFTSELGFERYTLFSAVCGDAGQPTFISLDNQPLEYTLTSSREDALRCPVMQRMKRDSRPFAYDQATYVAAGVPEMWEQQAPFGYGTGAVVALHLPNDEHISFGVDRSAGSLATCGAELTLALGAVQLLTTYCQETAYRLLIPARKQESSDLELTPRERETLQWTLEGKSSWAISHILGVSSATVDYHAKNAMRKLGVSSRHVAAMRAFNLGLL